MTRMGTVTLEIEKMDSNLMPYMVIHKVIKALDDATTSYIGEQVLLVETEGIALPDLDFTLETGDRLEFTADFYGEHFSYETDYGTEHDANYEFSDVAGLRVWRCVHEGTKP